MGRLTLLAAAVALLILAGCGSEALNIGTAQPHGSAALPAQAAHRVFRELTGAISVPTTFEIIPGPATKAFVSMSRASCNSHCTLYNGGASPRQRNHSMLGRAMEVL